MRAFAVAVGLWSVSPAFAAEAVGQVIAISLIEISGRASTAAIGSSTAASERSVGGPTGPQECADSTDCHADFRCDVGRCVSLPPPTGAEPNPSPDRTQTSLRRRGLELLVRARSVELREELALGQGPVIAVLATTQGLSAAKLGRALRKHQVELRQLIGDASRAEGAHRLMTRIEELSGRI